MPKLCSGCGETKVGGICRKCNGNPGVGGGGGGRSTSTACEKSAKSSEPAWVPSELPTQLCADPSCGNEGKEYRRCHGCKEVYYCSEQ